MTAGTFGDFDCYRITERRKWPRVSRALWYWPFRPSDPNPFPYFHLFRGAR